jgi:acyl-CoA synthetase (AMP-forming)/AMP-acid ligase II
MNLGLILTRTARLWPRGIGLVRADQQWTWGELERNANALAHALVEFGIGKGDRVLVQCPNDRYIYESHYAITRTGGVYTPLNFRASVHETLDMARRSHAKVLICDPEQLDKALACAAGSPELEHVIVTGTAPAAQADKRVRWHHYDSLATQFADRELVNVSVEHDDHVWHGFTAGTTGVPKGSIMSHGRLSFCLTSRIADVMPGLDHTHATLIIGPLSHGSGTTATCNTMKGAKIVMLSTSKFDEEECWRLIEEHRITSIFTVPTILMGLINHPARQRYDYSSLRHVIYAGAPLPRAHQKQALAVFGRVLAQYYGLAENMGTTSVLYPHMHSAEDDDPEAPLNSCGVARTGMEVAIMNEQMKALPPGEVGEICTRGPGNFWGYHEMPEETAQAVVDGWLRSGDLGRMDERGFLYIVGRSKEMYKSGGLQVYPNETENVLARHAAVDEAHVLSFPDSKWGEVGVALVKLKAGASATEQELIDHVAQFLARYKLPRRVFFLEAIPRIASGKVPKHLLREELYRRKLVSEGVDVPARAS